MKPRKTPPTRGLAAVVHARLVRLSCFVDRGGVMNGLLQLLTGWAVVRVKDIRLIMGNQCSCRAKMEGWTDSANRASAIQSLTDAHTVCGYLLRPSETAALQLESRIHASSVSAADKHHPGMDTRTPTSRPETRSHADRRYDREQTGNESGAAHTPARPSTSDRGSVSSHRPSPGETRQMDSSFLANAKENPTT